MGCVILSEPVMHRQAPPKERALDPDTMECIASLDGEIWLCLPDI